MQLLLLEMQLGMLEWLVDRRQQKSYVIGLNSKYIKHLIIDCSLHPHAVVLLWRMVNTTSRNMAHIYTPVPAPTTARASYDAIGFLTWNQVSIRNTTLLSVLCQSVILKCTYVLLFVIFPAVVV